MIEGRLSDLFVYPVKGCRGIRLSEARVCPTGLVFDRNWMIVRPDGRFISQRDVPVLAKIVPKLTRESLILHLPDGRYDVPLDAESGRIEVAIWKDRFDAFAQGHAIDSALSAHLGRQVRLVRFDPSVIRLSDPRVSPPGAHAAFSDEFPILLTSVGSLTTLNDHLRDAGAEPVPMARFRPNIVVDGLPAWAEDEHPLVTIDSIRLRLVSHCERCAVTTTDQIFGTRHGPEPIRMLTRIHADKARRPLFGWNAVPILDDDAEMTLAMGATVRLHRDTGA